jgi:hypothetical protein
VAWNQTAYFKPADYRTRIVLAAAFAALIVGYDAVVVAHIVTYVHFRDVWGTQIIFSAWYVLLIAMFTAVICANVWILRHRQRRVQAMMRRDPSVISVASHQPESSPALHGGEVLTLTHRGSANTFFKGLTILVYVPLWIVGYEFIIIQLLPSFRGSALDILGSLFLKAPNAPSSTALDWLAVGLPVLLAVSCMAYVAWGDIHKCFQRIVANDTGITMSNGLRRVFLAWDEIELFAQVSPEKATVPDILPTGNFVLWGHSQSANFAILAIDKDPDMDSFSRTWDTRFLFEDGYQTYLKDAQRLLATIVARARTPLLATHIRAPRKAEARWSAAIASLSERDAQTLPLAEGKFQPLVSSESEASHKEVRVSLKTRRQSAPITTSWANDLSILFLAVIYLLWAGARVIASTPALPFTVFAVITGAAFDLTMLGGYVVLFRRQQRLKPRADVRADEDGLTTWGPYLDQPTTLPWPSITAWVVIPPANISQPSLYVVYGDGLRLTWVEPAEAPYPWSGVNFSSPSMYRKQVAQLHALIAARTGQTLRKLQIVERAAATVSSANV